MTWYYLMQNTFSLTSLFAQFKLKTGTDQKLYAMQPKMSVFAHYVHMHAHILLEKCTSFLILYL